MSISALRGAENIPLSIISPVSLDRVKSILAKYLIEGLSVDPSVCVELFNQCKPLFSYEPFLDSFIENFETNPLITCRQLDSLPEMDAMKQAHNAHSLLYENLFVRILEEVINVGETVPFHVHPWDGIQMIIQGSRFSIANQEGSLREEEDQTGAIKKFKGNLVPIARTNIGSQQFRAITIEVKNHWDLGVDYSICGELKDNNPIFLAVEGPVTD